MAAALPAPPDRPLTPLRAGAGDISLMNLAGRQRMLSQRMVLQTVLAVQGHAAQVQAARQTLELFETSQARLLQTPAQLDAASAREVQAIYQGPQRVGAAIGAFARQVRLVLDLAGQDSARTVDALATLVGSNDGVLKALDAATTVFDQIQRRQSDAMLKELSGIVTSIQGVAREAKVVSFNAQVMAARAGAHGREFAAVANVLSGITAEIDRLSLQAVSLSGRGQKAA